MLYSEGVRHCLPALAAAHMYFPKALTELLPFYSNTQIKSLSPQCKRYIIVFIIGISRWMLLLLFFSSVFWYGSCLLGESATEHKRRPKATQPSEEKTSRKIWTRLDRATMDRNNKHTHSHNIIHSFERKSVFTVVWQHKHNIQGKQCCARSVKINMVNE